MEKLKSAGGMAAGLVVMLLIVAIPIILLTGLAAFSLWALEWIPTTIGISIAVCVAILPLAAIPSTRGLASSLYEFAAIAFVVCLWLYALAFTYAKWGMLAVIIGVTVFGVGIVFTGLLAAIFSATWVVLTNLLFLLALYIGSRLFAAWLAASAEKRRLEKHYRQTPSEAVITPASRADGNGEIF